MLEHLRKKKKKLYQHETPIRTNRKKSDFGLSIFSICSDWDLCFFILSTFIPQTALAMVPEPLLPLASRSWDPLRTTLAAVPEPLLPGAF